MRKNKARSSTINWAGVISFFVLIAFVMQMAILCYDYIREKTSNLSLIAILILAEIVILSTFCTLFDWVRRKIMVDRPTRKILQGVGVCCQGERKPMKTVRNMGDVTIKKSRFFRQMV